MASIERRFRGVWLALALIAAWSPCAGAEPDQSSQLIVPPQGLPAIAPPRPNGPQGQGALHLPAAPQIHPPMNRPAGPPPGQQAYGPGAQGGPGGPAGPGGSGQPNRALGGPPAVDAAQNLTRTNQPEFQQVRQPGGPPAGQQPIFTGMRSPCPSPAAHQASPCASARPRT